MVKIRVTIALVAALAAVVTTAAAVPLRLQFAEQGPIVSPDARDGGEVSLALRVLAVSLDGQNPYLQRSQGGALLAVRPLFERQTIAVGL